MSRVKKNILNGWKEIGAYVSRDIRTVERWEKTRGLPVRRIPGSGRATVYAVMSEVDEWMSSTCLDEQAPGLPAVEPQQVEPPVELGLEQPAAAGEFAVDLAPGTASSAAPVAERLAAQAADVAPMRRAADHILAVEAKRGWIQPLRWLSAAATVLAVALGATVFRPLLVHARHDDSTAASPGFDSGARKSSAVIPYSSRVQGVDDLCLSGIYYYEQRTPVALDHSMRDFKAAIAKDPDFAPSYAGMANAYILLREYSHTPDAEAYEGARAAAQRAIGLDPKLAQAHTSLAFVEFFWDWKAAEAEGEFRKAIELEPSLALAHHWYGSMLAHEGRFDEAIEQLSLAQRLEPSSAAIVSTKALALGFSGRREEAVHQLQDILEHSPSATSPHRVLGSLSRMEPHDLKRYLQESLRVAELCDDRQGQKVLETAQRALNTGGERAMWESILASEEAIHPGRTAHNYEVVEAEASLGRYDAAFEDLNRLVDRHDPAVDGILLEPALIPLRQDPRMEALLKRTPLAGYVAASK